MLSLLPRVYDYYVHICTSAGTFRKYLKTYVTFTNILE